MTDVKADFERMEATRRVWLEKMKGLSLTEYDKAKWEGLRKFVYPPRPLDVDVIIDDCTLREGLQMAGLVSPLPDDAALIGILLRDIGVERPEVLTYTKSD